MTHQNETLIKNIVGSIRKLNRAVYQDSARMSRSYGLTAAQSGVLRTIAKFGAASSAELSRRLFVTPSNITGVIDRLEKKGLVKRIAKPGDRRISLITLTEKGADLSRSLPDPIEKKLISGLSDLDTEQIRHLDNAVSRILSLMDLEKASAAPIDLTQIDSYLNPFE